MQTYPVRRGHVKKTDLSSVLQETFGSVKTNGDWFETSFGAMPTIRARYEGLTQLHVDSTSNANVSDEVAIETRKRWNHFLEGATGYTAKQRSKKAQEQAKKAGG